MAKVIRKHSTKSNMPVEYYLLEWLQYGKDLPNILCFPSLSEKVHLCFVNR